MSGLFEDDANVRPQPKKKKAEQPKKAKKAKRSVGSRIVAKIESNADVVGLAKRGGVDFAEVDIVSTAKAAKKQKPDGGKITPPINYIADEDDDV